jgi:hypothetical protein
VFLHGLRFRDEICGSLFHKRRFSGASELSNPALCILLERLIRLSGDMVGFPVTLRAFLFRLRSLSRLSAFSHSPSEFSFVIMGMANR